MYHEQLITLKTLAPITHIISLLEIVYSYEPLLLKTAIPATIIEVMLLKLTLHHESSQTSTSRPPGDIHVKKSSSPEHTKQMVVQHAPTVVRAQNEHVVQKNTGHDGAEQAKTPWPTFLKEIEALKDPLISSIFHQALFKAYDKDSGIVTITFAQQLVFFNEWLEKSRQLWQPLLERFFTPKSSLVWEFSEKSIAPVPKEVVQPAQAKNIAPVPQMGPASPPKIVQKNTNAELRALKESPQAQLLLRVFPGSLSIAKENSHE